MIQSSNIAQLETLIAQATTIEHIITDITEINYLDVIKNTFPTVGRDVIPCISDTDKFLNSLSSTLEELKELGLDFIWAYQITRNDEYCLLMQGGITISVLTQYIPQLTTFNRQAQQTVQTMNNFLSEVS